MFLISSTKKTQQMKKYFFMIAMIFIATISYGQLKGVKLKGTYNGAFQRGMQATDYCGNDPESWVRGSAFLDKKTGLLKVQVQLETDDLRAGPKGIVHVFIFDKNNKQIAAVKTAEIGRGGKLPGKADRTNVSSVFSLGNVIGQKAASMTIIAQCTGHVTKIFNIDIGLENPFTMDLSTLVLSEFKKIILKK
jgi:hypothetical protein